MPRSAPSTRRYRPCGCPSCAQALSGDKGFLTKARLSRYADKRNDPTVPNALSGLSPYLHFGHLSAQRAAIEAAKCKAVHKVGGWVGGWVAPPAARRPPLLGFFSVHGWAGRQCCLATLSGLKKRSTSDTPHPTT